jgi:hypothetical protein
MKNQLNKNFWTIPVLLGALTAAGLSACSSDDDDTSSAPMKITAVYLEDAQSSANPDRRVEFARLGQTIRLNGAGFTGMKKIYINGYQTYFNPVFVTESNVWVSISGKTPTVEAEEAARNTIALEKDGQARLVYPFEIRAAAPTVASISHTMPQAGDRITLRGTGLQGVTAVTFPGNVKVTEGITSDDEEGEFCAVTVPEGVSDEGGSLLVTCANGGAYSPACFNFKRGLYQNFDDVNNYSWASGIDDAGTPITDPIPATGERPQSQGGYHCFNAAGASIAANSDMRYWTNSDSWPSALLSAIPASTAAADCGVQMDIYVEGEWTSGVIRMVMADGSGTDRYCMVYRPWYVNGAVAPFENPGKWFTVTFPFSNSEDYQGKTFGDVVASMTSASYKQSGPWFHNIGVPGASGQPAIVEPEATSVKIYFDNLRVVPLSAPAFSDFPDDDDE